MTPESAYSLAVSQAVSICLKLIGQAGVTPDAIKAAVKEYLDEEGVPLDPELVFKASKANFPVSGDSKCLYIPLDGTDIIYRWDATNSKYDPVGKDLSDYYTKGETDDKISDGISEHNEAADAHQDIRDIVDEKVDKVNGKGLSTNDFTDDYKAALDSLDDALGGKVDKVPGKELSTNDYTTEEKNKLAGIDDEANKYIHPTHTAYTGTPTENKTPGFGDTFEVSQPVSDSLGHITAINSRTVKIPDTVATTSAAGLMSADDKTILDNIKLEMLLNLSEEDVEALFTE